MFVNRFTTRRSMLVPEVVQTSAMDCGPASLKCLCEGFRIPVSYGRLREACQTDVDGTSIDTMEQVAAQLGLDAEQIMVPADHLLLPAAQVLPAIVVVRLANNATHFVVAWRRYGRLLQLMDPATGRRWSTSTAFLDEVYVHTTTVPAADWREWASSPEFIEALRTRMAGIGLTAAMAKRRINNALADPGWRPLAALDATVRMTTAIVQAGGISPGRQAAKVIERLSESATNEGSSEVAIIPAEYWSAQPTSPGADGEEQALLRGAVMVRVRGRQRSSKPERPVDKAFDEADEAAPLSPELVAALEEQPVRPGRELLGLLRADGVLTPAVLLVALLLAAGGVVIEALLFRGLFDIGRDLTLAGQRLGAVGALLAFMIALLLLELPIAAMVLRYGRHLETRLRKAFMEKIPRLGDRYFHSRLTSDMAERSHSLYRIRLLPELGERFLRLSFELLLTTAAIIWLDPSSAPLAICAAAVAVGVPLAAQPVLLERDLRMRNHNGGLSRFYLDALIGLVAVRAHGAERAVRREHDSLLSEWVKASFKLQRAVVTAEGLQFFAGFGLAAWLLLDHVARAGESPGLLLFIYWALNLPVLGGEIALIVRQYPDYRNVTLRLMEPLGALEEVDQHQTTVHVPVDPAQLPKSSSFAGVAISLEGVSVRAAGHTILEDVDLCIEAGEHLAIVGSSGAGKSSLVGLLLGWHRSATGSVLVDGEPLDGRQLERLRSQTAWVDPTVQLWNRTFLDNLRYGSPPDGQHAAINSVIESADLLKVLEKLPDGLQTPLGEGGALVSGGEGQRVRLGRAMLRPDVQLVILDEPFRGLERERRRKLLARARELWRDATLICITHDVGETQSFERVIVVHDGRILEDDAPSKLAACIDSRYHALLAAEEEVRTGLWSDRSWRRLRLQDKHLSECVAKECGAKECDG